MAVANGSDTVPAMTQLKLETVIPGSRISKFFARAQRPNNISCLQFRCHFVAKIQQFNFV